MEFQDKALRCVDCGSEFIWTAGEQLFFADKQFKNEPKRCKACNGQAIFPAYFVDVAGRCALESAPACASLAYSPLFERFWQGPN